MMAGKSARRCSLSSSSWLLLTLFSTTANGLVLHRQVIPSPRTMLMTTMPSEPSFFPFSTSRYSIPTTTPPPSTKLPTEPSFSPTAASTTTTTTTTTTVVVGAVFTLGLLSLGEHAHAFDSPVGTAGAAVVFDKSIFIRGAISGACINLMKNLVLHPIETAKTRLDTGATDLNEILGNLYSGIAPSLAGGIPSAAIFFGVKDCVRDVFRHVGIDPVSATLLSVTIGQIPYWLLRNPSMVITTRMRTGKGASIQEILSKGDIKDLYSGLESNLLYSLPSDYLKFIFYDFFANFLFGIREGQGNVEALPAIVCGSLTGLVAETIATPLDVARTRIMCMEDPEIEGCVAVVMLEEGPEEARRPGGDGEERVANNEASRIGACDGALVTPTFAMENTLDRLGSVGGVATTVATKAAITVAAKAATTAVATPTSGWMQGSSKNPYVVVWNLIRYEKLSTLFAGAVPRSTRALLDGAVQFYSYEATQNILHKYFDNL